MLLVLGGALGLAAGLLTGGSMGNLLARRLRWPLVVLAALLLKELGIRTPLAFSPLAPWLFALTLVVLIAWALSQLDRLPGIWLVAAGVSMNLLAAAANGGRMPVAPALAGQGPPQLLAHGAWAQYVLAGPGTRLGWLGDWLQLPGPAGSLFPQAYSPGDLVAFAGMAVVLFLVTRNARPLPRRGAVTTP